MSTDFAPGERVQLGAMWFKVEEGGKACLPCRSKGISPPCGHDRVLLWMDSYGEWHPVDMAAGLLIAEFFYVNEDTLYPKWFHRKNGEPMLGGDYYWTALVEAIDAGWRRAADRIKAERAARKRRAS